MPRLVDCGKRSPALEFHPMAVLVTCKCDRHFHTPDLDRGRITQCPDCGRDLVVPGALRLLDKEFGGEKVSPPRTSPLAAASLCLGTAALFVLPAVPAPFVFSAALAGIPAILLGSLALASVYRSKGRLEGKGAAFTGIVLGGFACFTVMQFVAASRPREAARRAQCANNVRQLGLAMENFRASEGHFPPAAITDPSGKPLLSWRVAILPYLEQQNSLYRKFKLDEPWDSPHNRPLLAEMPLVFACPSDPDSKPSKTRYLALTGPGTVFDGNLGIPVSAILDRPSVTLMVVETKNPVEWTKPENQPFGPNLPLPTLDSLHPGGANALFADGSTRFLKSTILPGVLRSLITRNGGEVIAADSF